MNERFLVVSYFPDAETCAWDFIPVIAEWKRQGESPVETAARAGKVLHEDSIPVAVFSVSDISRMHDTLNTGAEADLLQDLRDESRERFWDAYRCPSCGISYYNDGLCELCESAPSLIADPHIERNPQPTQQDLFTEGGQTP